MEHWRSHWPRCAGTVLWQLNDCWPVTSWAAIDGNARLKPLYFEMRRLYADRLLTLQLRDGALVVAGCNQSAATWDTTVIVRRMDADGTVLASAEVLLKAAGHSVALEALPRSVTEFGDARREFLVADADGSRAVHFTCADREFVYPAASYEVQVSEGDSNGVAVTVTAAPGWYGIWCCRPTVWPRTPAPITGGSPCCPARPSRGTSPAGSTLLRRPRAVRCSASTGQPPVSEASARRSGHVTINDVAARAGVSRGAVSLAFDNHAGVSAATRERIMEAVTELGWVPSQTAIKLSGSATGAAGTVGLVIARPARQLGLPEPFYMEFISGAESVLEEHRCSLLLHLVRDVTQEIDVHREWWQSGERTRPSRTHPRHICAPGRRSEPGCRGGHAPELGTHVSAQRQSATRTRRRRRRRSHRTPPPRHGTRSMEGGTPRGVHRTVRHPRRQCPTDH
ncbi:hypothetical protein SGLAM104S_01851 [Streptomyces glaucescens]